MNSAHLSPDDPRLSAYAFGELAGEEHAMIAAAVQADPALAAEVHRLRTFAAELHRALAEEPVESTPVSAGTGAAKGPKAATRAPAEAPRAQVVRVPYVYWVGTAAAAVLALALWLQNLPGPAGAPAAGPVGGPPKIALTGSGSIVKANRPVDQVAPADAGERAESSVAPARAAAPAGDANAAQSTAVVTAVAPVTPTVPSASPASAAKDSAGTLALDGSYPYVGGPNPGSAPAVAGGAFGVGGAGGGAGGGRGGRGRGAVGGAVGGGGGGGGGGGAAGARASGARAANTLGSYGPAPTYVEVANDADVLYRYPALPPNVIVVRRRPLPAPRPPGGEAYAHLLDNPFTDPVQAPLSTFALDVDTASYANVRRFLTNGRLPPPDAVRIEEMVNYFPYHYSDLRPAEVPAGSARPAAAPFVAGLATAQAPWMPSHRLVRVAVKARDVPATERGPANLVFLLDVSGSMDEPNKLPLVKESMRLLLSRLRPDDRVAIVTYAGESGLALPSTPVSARNAIINAIDGLSASGGTNGGAGIQLAYQVAQANFNREGVNRIVLCTDGDFNVGVTSRAELTRMIAERAQGGVSLTVLGFGMGNLKDAMLESLADQGHGNYGYIDTRREAEKLFVEQLSGTLVTVAKDVKVQVEFNPARVAAYRLIGYEDRLLPAPDFNNDRVTAGDVGAGHTVTALYEVIPVGADEAGGTVPAVDPSRYTAPPAPAAKVAGRPAPGAHSEELLTVKIRYKLPDADVSQRLEFPLVDRGGTLAQADTDFQFAAAVAGFGMVLRESPYRGGTTLSDVLAWAERAAGDDPGGERAEFTDLVRRARDLRREPAGGSAPLPSPAPPVDPLRY